MDAKNLTADELLTFPKARASELFGSDPKSTFHQLAKCWHPDVSKNPKATQVFEHIVSLKDFMEKGEGQICVEYQGKLKIFHLEVQAQTSTGQRWVGPGLYAWTFEKAPDLEPVFIKNLKGVPFADKKMREQMRTTFPNRMHRVTYDGHPMVIFPRQEFAVLADWIDTHGPLPPVHAAWVGSGLLNIASYAAWSHWVFPGIALDTVAINPKTHEVMLVAGWEEAAQVNERPKVASKRTLSLYPALTVPGYMPLPTLTQDVVRQTLREALGDPSGLGLRAKGIPAGMAEWIQAPSAVKGTTDYIRWQEALENDFGKRKFVKWDKSITRVYPNIEY